MCLSDRLSLSLSLSTLPRTDKCIRMSKTDIYINNIYLNNLKIIYIYIYIEECIFRQQVSFVKDDGTLFIIFNSNFSCLLVIFLMSGSRWYNLPTPLLGQDMTQGQFLSGV